MAPPFIFPQTLRALEDDSDSDNSRLSVQFPTDITSLRPSDLEEFVKGLSFDLSDKEIFCVEEQDVFDRVYSLVRDFSALSSPCKLNLVESLRSNLSVLLPNVDSLSRLSQAECEDTVVDRIALHRNAFKIYTFFLIHIVLAEENNTSTTTTSKVAASSRKKHLINSWNWEPQRGRILNLLANSLDINLSLLFGSSDPDENYLSFIMKNVVHLLENATLLKDPETKDAMVRIIGACATKYHYTAQSCASMLHLMHKYDFVVTHVADAVASAERKYADGTLAIALVREIGKTNPKDYAKDNVGAENIGRFLVELSDRMPRLISSNVGLLVPHFGGESYKMRNALVGVLGKLVAKGFKDAEGELSTKSIRLRTKHAMLEILLERCRDVSAYTRSRVLQVWAELCEEHAISIGLWNEVAAIAAGRLEDKSAVVRKSALNLLIMMLQHNPFGPQLRMASFEATLEQYKKKLEDLGPDAPSESVLDGLPSDDNASNGDGEVDNANTETVGSDQQESYTDSCLPHEDGGNENSVPDIGNLEQTRALVASLEAGLRFSKCVSAMMPTLVQLMASPSATDVENTILLLMRCRQFQVDGSESCLRKMLPLVFSQDKSIYEAVESAFVTIYVTKNPTETAKNLLNLAIESNIGDLAALEFMIDALVSKSCISTSTISALWDFFCFNVSGTSALQSRGALSILCMAAKSSAGILGSHIQDIIDIGFGRWAKVDPLLARTACTALQRLSEEDKRKLLVNNGSRVFSMLESLITGFWLPEDIWFAAIDKAIDAIYAIHPTPEMFAADVVKRSLISLSDGKGGNELQNDTESGSTEIPSTVQLAKLSKFLFVVSHVAMNHLAYIESCVKKIQKQRAKKERMDAERQNLQSNGSIIVDNSKENGINAELGLAASEDAILDTLSERAEKEIVSGGAVAKNLIGFCAPFVSKLCRNISLMQKYPELQASVVESAPSETVRSNCTIALGDLAVRFPNLLEPWTEKMYARLRDPSDSVRKNAVLVLSHLILNDMMKVKGYINEMAIRVEDEDERISNLAKLFFNELSKKGSNPIYNLLPDILGKLSQQNLRRESFCNIMQFLIGSIKKDKQMEALVEKLCNRFSGVTDIVQWDYISYCLSQLAFTEKGIKKLMDSFKCYEHALSEESVMENFRSIITKAKKFAKLDMKSSLEEFEEKLNKFHMEKKEQDITARNAQDHQQRIGRLEGLVVAKEENAETDGSEDSAEDEVIDPSRGTMSQCLNDLSRSKFSGSDENSGASSEMTEAEPDGTEVTSPRPRVISNATSRSRMKKTKNKDQKVVARASNRRK
ncbi:Condensin complex subunit 1, N-terminal [Dillenia turbinata]|uniref:Condensin-1 complex subunit CAP-D2 n=1 Tax=Dillenia turbinata TaxID=194707 RepID=A0AAN8W875_9MAGN